MWMRMFRLQQRYHLFINKKNILSRVPEKNISPK